MINPLASPVQPWWSELSSPRSEGVRTRQASFLPSLFPGIPSMRSALSLQMEALVRRETRDGLLARLADIPLERHTELTGWIAVVHPDARARRLTIMHAGASLCAMQADPMMGTDYLDLVDPAYKGEAFDSVFMMLSRPCGLWQLSPVRYTDGTSDVLELTGFPVFDEENGRGVILFLIWNAGLSFHGVTSVGHAQTWAWLELRDGVAS